jgi:transketolase
MKILNKKNIIEKILLTATSSKEGHIPSALSILDLLYVIYKDYVNLGKARFVLSKGHASIGLYAILEHFNILEENLENFCKFNSKLGGHPSCRLSNVECSTGSLGHGFPFALGLAMAQKIQNSNMKIFTIIGDGEANEGTIWETALLANHHKINNLCCILDYNHSTDRALDIGNMLDKFNSFGWMCSEVDGHNISKISKTLSKVDIEKPHFILAHTIKGKGVKCMENNPEWHHKFPNLEEYEIIIKELKENI